MLSPGARMGLGIAWGAAVGVVMQNIPVGVALGVVAGSAFSAVHPSKRCRDGEEKQPD